MEIVCSTNIDMVYIVGTTTDIIPYVKSEKIVFFLDLRESKIGKIAAVQQALRVCEEMKDNIEYVEKENMGWFEFIDRDGFKWKTVPLEEERIALKTIRGYLSEKKEKPIVYVEEGKKRKGGVNLPPTTPRPPEPKGQRSINDYFI